MITSILCLCAQLRFLKSKKFHIFYAGLFRGDSQLKPKFGQLNYNHTIKISIIQKNIRDYMYSCDLRLVSGCDKLSHWSPFTDINSGVYPGPPPHSIPSWALPWYQITYSFSFTKTISCRLEFIWRGWSAPHNLFIFIHKKQSCAG